MTKYTVLQRMYETRHISTAKIPLFFFDRNSCNCSHTFTVWFSFILCSIRHVVHRTISRHFYYFLDFWKLWNFNCKKVWTIPIFSVAIPWQYFDVLQFGIKLIVGVIRKVYVTSSGVTRDGHTGVPLGFARAPGEKKWNYRIFPEHRMKNNAKL